MFESKGTPRVHPEGQLVTCTLLDRFMTSGLKLLPGLPAWIDDGVSDTSAKQLTVKEKKGHR